MGLAAPSGAAASSLLDVVISEVMPVPPAQLSFPMGQWFELYNASDVPLDLAGCHIQVGQDGQGPSYLMVDSVPMAPGAYLVVGPSKAWALNGGIHVDVALGLDSALPTVSGFIRLLCNDQLVDEINYGPEWGLAAQEGISLSLEVSAQDSELNDDVTRWCLSTILVPDALVPAYGSPGGAAAACDSDKDGLSEDLGDCNDTEPMVLPGMTERCNGVDDNCDGTTDEEPLLDSPVVSKVGACADSMPICLGATGYGWQEAGAYEETEVTCDGVDNDCDGLTDEELRNLCGQCGEELPDECNGVDDDCDGTTDEGALPPPGFTCPGQGIGVCLTVAPLCNGTWTCSFPLGYQQEESLCDLLDNDCDGLTDEGFALGAACAVGEGSCRSEGTLVCSTDPSNTKCAAPKIPSTAELCGDDVDNDCDGETDEGFSLGDVCYSGKGVCKQAGKYFCSSDGLYAICSADPIPASEEVCHNELDDNCNGLVDELPCAASVDSTLTGCSAQGPNSLFCVKSAFPLSILIGILAGVLWVLGRWALNRSAQKRMGVGPEEGPEGR